MLRKVFKTSRSVVSLPKDLIESLRIGEGNEVNIVGQFVKQVDEFIDQHRTAMEELAMNDLHVC